MLHRTECFQARSIITELAVLNDDSIAFSTEVHGVKIFSPESCSSIKNLSLDLLSYTTTAVAFSLDRELLAIANGSIIHIINTQNKTLLQTIKTFEGKIMLMSFVPNSKYIITGTKNGRVMQYRYDGRSHLSRLCSFGQTNISMIKKSQNNYVSCFAFHEDIFASSGYGGIITILRMNTYTNRHTIEASKVRISALCFLDAQRIVSANVDGLVKIHMLKKYTSAKSINTPFTNINSIIIMPNPQFIMISAESNKVAIIDTKLHKLVSSNYLSFKGDVTKIALTKDNNLLAIIDSKKLLKIELPTAEHIKSFILHNSLDKAYELIEKDPMLQGTREHKRVEVMYEKQYTKAIEALIEAKTQEARQLMRMFSDIESKKEDIKAIFKAFEFFPRFQALYLDKKHALSYAMAEKYPALKYTKQYKKMEESFKETFSFAQKQVLMGRADVAKEILKPYTTTLAKKSLLNLVLKQNEDFILFLKAISEKKYALVDKLVEKNELFKQIPTYIEMKKEIQNHLTKIKKLILDNTPEDAIKEIQMLIEIPQLKHELQDLYRDARASQKIQKAYANNDFVKCYEILDGDVNIEELEIVQLLEKHYAKLIDRAEESALKADVKGIKKVLGELLYIKTRADKVGDLFRVSFHTKIKALLAKRNFKGAESIIYAYIDIFGTDREMQQIMSMYEKVSSKKLAITLNQTQRVPRDRWLHSSLTEE